MLESLNSKYAAARVESNFPATPNETSEMTSKITETLLGTPACGTTSLVTCR